MRIMSLGQSQTHRVGGKRSFGWTAQVLKPFVIPQEKDFARLRELTSRYSVEEFVLGCHIT